MSNERSTPQTAGGPKLPPWLVVVLILGFMGFSWWQNSRAPNAVEPPAQTDGHSQSNQDDSPSHQDREPVNSSSATPPSGDSDEASFKVEHQSIRDLNGRVVYQGTIDLGPTLARIKRGESNRHRNDGTPFQNRELRLPRKGTGYYKEYVHPTPGENGPGPQRIIIGQAGEIWYTPDHYKTFKQIKSARSD